MGTVDAVCLHRQCAQHCMARKLGPTLIAAFRMLNTLAVLLLAGMAAQTDAFKVVATAESCLVLWRR